MDDRTACTRTIHDIALCPRKQFGRSPGGRGAQRDSSIGSRNREIRVGDGPRDDGLAKLHAADHLVR